MIRTINKQAFICYDATGEPFDGPFGSEGEAAARLAQMRPVDRMLVSGRGPFLNTDATFLEGTETTGGKKYLRQLAKFPGDPRALVTGRGDVRRVCQERGMICEGMVNVKIEEPEPAERIPIAEDIVDRETAKMLKGTRGMPEKKKRELREAVREKITPK